MAPEPKIGILNSLSKVFNVSIDDLINIDLEKKEKEIKINNERKEVQFCKKLIEDTKNNLLEWEYFDIGGDLIVSIEDDFVECGYFGIKNSPFYLSECYEDFSEGFTNHTFSRFKKKFKSKFTYDEYSGDYLSYGCLIANISPNIKVILMSLIIPPNANEDLNLDKIDSIEYIEHCLSNYEMYLVQNENIIFPSCSSYKYSAEFFKDFTEDYPIYDDVIDSLLECLYKLSSDYISFGRNAYQKQLIYDSYINNENLVESN